MEIKKFIEVLEEGMEVQEETVSPQTVFMCIFPLPFHCLCIVVMDKFRCLFYIKKYFELCNLEDIFGLCNLKKNDFWIVLYERLLDF